MRQKTARRAQRRIGRSSRWRRNLTVTATALVAIVVVLTLDGTNQPLFERLRNIVFDSYQRLAPRQEAGAPLVIVDIDQPSINAIGQWPWARTTIADMLKKLGDAGAAAIAYDITFSEPDRTSPVLALAQLKSAGATVQLPPNIELDNDAVLAKAFGAYPVVAGFAISDEAGADKLPVPKAGFSFGGADPKSYLPDYRGGVTNLPALSDAASGVGFFSFPPSNDGVIRSIPVVALAQGNLYPALSIEALRLAQGAGSYVIRSTGASGEADTGLPAMVALKDGSMSMPTGPGGEVQIYFSGLKSVPTIAAKDLAGMDAATLAEKVQGRIVMIGTSAIGLRDLVATPIGIIPGVRVHAEIIDQIFGQTFLDRPDWAYGAEIALAVVLGLVVLGLSLSGSAVVSTSGTIILLAVAGGISWWAFSQQRLLLDPILPAVASLAVFALSTPLLLLWTDRERQFINNAFSRYLSPDLVGRLAANPSALTLGGELRELTILFSDIRDFTSISEQLAPDELTSLLNNFLTPATDALLRSEATIDKYIGDAIVAFWNAPLDIEGHPRKACLGALRVLDALAELNRASGRQLKIGIGLNSGTCCVGNFGSAQRFSYSAIGDSMNLASRVESLTKQYRVPILVTEATQAKVADLAFLEADLVRVVGHSQPVAIFALLGDAEYAQVPAFLGFCDLHSQFLRAYRDLDFDSAETAAAAAQAAAPEAIRGLYDVYFGRLAAMRVDPPAPGWDGVFTATSK